MITPIGWEYDLGFRVAARYGLDFFITGEYSLIERGEYRDESREPTYPEISMWHKVVPEDLRVMLSKLWRVTDRMVIDAIPEEFHSALPYRKLVYLNGDDFTVARGLKDFKPELRRDQLKSGRFGTHQDTTLYVSRDIPKGYFLPTDIPIPWLNWRPPAGVRALKPEPDFQAESEVVMGLRPLRCMLELCLCG